MSVRAVLVVTLVLVSACGAAQPRRPADTTGAILGLVRDKTTGEPIAMAEVALRRDDGLDRIGATKTTNDGVYDFDALAPGLYSVNVYFAGDGVEVDKIKVVAGRVAPVDVALDLGQPGPVVVIDYSHARDGAID